MVLPIKRIPKLLFGKLYKEGKQVNNQYFRLVFQLKTKENPQRFSFVVSKSISKKAVTRNKLKRWGYSTLRKSKILKKPIFCIVFLKKGVEKLDFEGFYGEFSNILTKIIQ